MRPLAECDHGPACTECRERLAGQLATWGGPLLDGLALPDAPDFENWLEPFRERAQTQALLLMRQLAACHVRLGSPQQAIPLLQQALGIDPWDEEIHRQLMQLLAASGQTAAALAQFEQCRSVLYRDLGLEPARETLALQQRILQGAFAAPVLPAAVAPPERRQIFVLVCEFGLDEGGDHEFLADALGQFVGIASSVFHALGAYAVPPQFGRLLAYFGYPAAHEDAARQTLEAALRLQAAVSSELGVRWRMGAHAGWVVDDARQRVPDAVGLISRHAAQLAEAVSWGEIAVSTPLQSLCEGFFSFAPLGGKSFAEALLLRGRSGVSHRLEIPGRPRSPLVGRRRELRLLAMLWSRTRAGQRQALLMHGEAGIGKSRLIEAVQDEVLRSGGVWRKLRCQPEFQHTPYYPVIDFLQRSLDHLQAGAPPGSDRLRLLAEWLTPDSRALSSHWPALVELLQPGQGELDETPPAQRKKRTEAALFALLEALADAQPVLLVLEDIHWADPSTLALLENYLAQGRGAVFLLLSSRQENQALTSLRRLHLQPLGADAAARLARAAAGAGGLAPRALQAVLERADGIPLYLEEMARALSASGEQSIPGSLWNLLAVRLEAAGDARRLARQASVIGRSFRLALLAALWDGPPAAVNPGIERLIDAGVLQPFGSAGFRFRHALMRDAAFETLALPERRALHSRLATLYRGEFQALVADSPEVLAQHLAEAGEVLAAAEAWLAAGRLAASRSAHVEAVFHFEAGLARLVGLPTAQTAALELSLQAALGTVLIAVKGYGAEAAKQCFARALALTRSQGSEGANDELFQVTWGLWLGGRSCTPEAYPLELVHKLEQIAEATGDPAHWMQVHYAYGNNLFWLARYREARAHLEQAVALGQGLSSAALVKAYGEDTGISSQAFLGWIDWIEGEHARAQETAAAAVAAARRLGHAHTLCFALTFQTVLHRFLRLAPKTAGMAAELRALADEHELSLWQAAAHALHGWAAATMGQREALPLLRQMVEAARQAMLVVEGTFIAFLIDALMVLAEHEEGLSLTEDVIPRCHAHGDLYYLPEFLRLRAEAIVRLDAARSGEARQILAQAAALAETHGALSLRLRIAVSRLRHGLASEMASARAELRAILAAFAQQQESPDLREARLLLASSGD